MVCVHAFLELLARHEASFHASMLALLGVSSLFDVGPRQWPPTRRSLKDRDGVMDPASLQKHAQEQDKTDVNKQNTTLIYLCS